MKTAQLRCAHILAGLVLFCVTAGAQTPAPVPPPDWLYPIDPNYNPKAPPPKLDDVELLKIPGSAQGFTAARINNLFEPPDWFPEEHGPMPDVVAKGRKPQVFACAMCHTPTGQGRPENSPLAGLSEGYIRQQLLDMRSGARKPVGPEAYLPNTNMFRIAKAMTDKEIDESAKYYSQQKARRRVYVIESLRIPRAEPKAWLYQEVGGTEDLDDRLLEVTNEFERHERRDPKLEYLAYVPPGSQMRGKRLVTTGDGGKTQVCAACHGSNLKGLQDVPPIAGRSPSYLLRQMLVFQHGARTNEPGKQMTPVVEKLALEDMIGIVAYLASLPP